MAARFRVGSIEVSQQERRVWRDGTLVPLGARAFDVLSALLERPNEVVLKEQLLRHAWPGRVVEENNLTVQIAALRRTLGADLIATVPRRGYKLRADVVPAHPGPVAGGRNPVHHVTGDLQLPDKPSVAVLPFANLSDDAGKDWFIDGIVEDITAELSRFSVLFVVARNSSFTYRGRHVDVRQVGRELGVRYIVEGSMRLSGERVRVNALLVDAATATHIWAERYDGAIGEIFEVQEEVARCVVAAIAPHIELSETSRARRVRPEALNAYELAVRAWAAAQDGFRAIDRASRDEALRLAREALNLDGRSSTALRAIAMACWQDVLNHTATSAQGAHQAGMEAIQRALAIDPNDEWAHAFRGMLMASHTEGKQGLGDVQRAHEVNPNNAFILAVLGLMEAVSGQPVLAKKHIARAMRLSPLDPRTYLMLSFLAWAHFALMEYDLALQVASDSLAEAPNYAPSQMCLAISLVGLGELDAAKAAWRRLVQFAPEFAQARTDDHTMASDSQYRERRTAFARIAAGLEEAVAVPDAQCWQTVPGSHETASADGPRVSTPWSKR